MMVDAVRWRLDLDQRRDETARWILKFGQVMVEADPLRLELEWRIR